MSLPTFLFAGATIFCYVVHLSVMSVCYHKIYKRVSQLKLDPLTPPLSSDIMNNEVISLTHASQFYSVSVLVVKFARRPLTSRQLTLHN